MTDWGSLTTVGLGVVFAGFLLDWLAVSLGWKKIRPYTKMAALTLLIVWALARLGFRPGLLGWLLILALAFGLLGDFLLLFPDRCFKWGLGAFLLGHFTYLLIYGLLIIRGCETGQLVPIPGWAWVVMAAVLGGGLLLFYWAIIRRMPKPCPSRLLQAALYIYAISLASVMIAGYLLAALFTDGSALLWTLPLGGTLFFISDFILAYNRFVRPVRLAHLWIMSTYHLAQFFLAVGFLNAFPLIG